jgi:hypothetical protein
MTHLGNVLCQGLLIAGVLAATAAQGQTGDYRIKGNSRDEKVVPRPSPKAPVSAGVRVIRAEFGEDASEPAAAAETATPEGILVYATEYFTRKEERTFKGSISAGSMRNSDIRYGSGEQRSEIRYGSGEQRSEIRYGSGEQRSEIRYGSGEQRSEIRYGSGDRRSDISYGGAAK